MKPSVYHCEDGSILIEWIDKDKRFFISFEQDPAESSWGFVSKAGDFEGGHLDEHITWQKS